MTIGIVIARGGSTRTPNKNGKLMCGVPLLAWSVIQSKTAKLIDETFLVTDSKEYIEIGEKYGAIGIQRPVWDNGVQGGKSFLYGMDYIEKELKMKVDEVVYFMATSPLKKPGEVDAMIEAFRESGVDTMTTAAPIKETYVLKNCKGSYWDRFKKKSLGNCYQGKMQIADSYWKYSRMCGGWGIGKRDTMYNNWLNSPTMDFECTTRPVDRKTKVDLFPVEDWQCFEVDYPIDFEICEVLMENMILKGKNARIYGDNVPLSEEETISSLLGKYNGNNNQQ